MPQVLAEYPQSYLTISSTVRKPVLQKSAGELYRKIKDRILGPEYELSLVFVGVERSRALNHQLRGLDKPATVLSFPLTEQSGEVFLCPTYATRRADEYERSPENFLLFLFIHGCFHLKGMEHGGRMEANERQERRVFGI